MSIAVVEPRGSAPMTETAEPRPPSVPRLPTAAEVSREEGARVLREVRQFHLSGRGDGLARPDEQVLPVLMHAFRDPDRIRSDYPLLLLPVGEKRTAAGLGDWMRDTIEAHGGSFTDIKMLGDNLPGLELAARSHGGDGGDPRALLGEVAGVHADSISLRDADRQTFTGDVATLAGLIPDGSTLLTLTRHAGVLLMAHAALRRAAAERAEFDERINDLRVRLVQLLDEDNLLDERGSTDRYSSQLAGEGGINTAALAKIMSKRKRGGTGMSPARRERITHATDIIGSWLGADSPDRHVFVHAGELDGAELADERFELVQADLPCAEAARRFDELAERFVPVALAVRIAELELSGSYDESVYGPMIDSFGRGSLSAQEKQLLPAVVAVETIERLGGPDMPNITRALLSGRPIRVMLDIEPSASLTQHTEHDPLDGFRFEPGFFGMGHRVAQVHQTAASRSEHLLDGFERALAAPIASLHVIAAGRCEGGGDCSIGAPMHNGAALAGRAHPIFRYDPSAGRSWADRFDFDGNEQPENDWPVHELACLDAGGGEMSMELAFSFADFALLEPAFTEQFRMIPDSCPTNDLTPVDQFPIDDETSSDRRVPFVWGADASGRMMRLAISRRLLGACRDRLGAWRTLQEYAGIHNAHAEQAAAEQRTIQQSKTTQRIDELQAEHETELERIREEMAGEAMQRLAEMLLRVDLSGGAPLTAGPAPAPLPTDTPKQEVVETVEPEPEPPAEEEEEIGFDEPYIDSALCTSCNDCIDLNKQLFVYNANKQAEIGDPNAGTFAQLVEAAEKCPARCIHPGKPLNADEPDLDSLIARAKPFN